MADESPDGGLEIYSPTGGRVTGVLGLVVAAAFAVAWVLDRDSFPAPVGAAALVGGVLVYASLLRPRVSTSPETLFLRNMLVTVHVPLAAIDELAVRQVLAARVGDKRFVSPAIGRKLRKVMRAPRPQPMLGSSVPEAMDDAIGPATVTEREVTDIDYADFVEGRIRERMAAARTRHGVQRYSDEAEALARDVRRELSWPLVGALVVTVLLLVATLVA